MRFIDFSSSFSAPIHARLDSAAQAFLTLEGAPRFDFSEPRGEPALSGPDSVSWRVFKNPVSLFIGGVTAVLLEFAEPRVRAGVWDHSIFRRDPVTRLRRTGLAAMATVYGARSRSERMIASVNRIHQRVSGTTPSGEAYAASDLDLLNWVQATASYGFLEAYANYVAPLSEAEKNRFYAESRSSARLYGATGAPTSIAEQRALFAKMAPRFERSNIIFEFISIMRKAQALPGPLQLAQRVFIRAAVDLLPDDVRRTLGLTRRYGLRPFEGRVVKRLGRRADLIVLASAPPAQACLRLGLPADYLYRKAADEAA